MHKVGIYSPFINKKLKLVFPLSSFIKHKCRIQLRIELHDGFIHTKQVNVANTKQQASSQLVRIVITVHFTNIVHV